MKCFMCFKWEGLIFREELEVRAEITGVFIGVSVVG